MEHRTKYKHGCGYVETNPQSIWSGGGGWNLKCTASGKQGGGGVAGDLQGVKKVVSDSPGLVDFAIKLVILVLNLPDGKCCFLRKFKLQKNC